MRRGIESNPKLPLTEQQGQTFVRLVEVMQRLLAPGGCPWDREQDYRSLRRYVLEEACEVIDAIDSGDRDELREELGDLALQVVFLSELARKDGAFGPDDVVHGIVDKLVRRHPHVFGDVEVSGSEEVLQNWERIKATEKSDRPLLDRVPRSMPALHRAQRIGDKVRRVGFDWEDDRGARAKIDEELAELDEAAEAKDTAKLESELGDVLFSLVNLARHHGIDAEQALRHTTDRFTQRFGYVEQKVKAEHGGWPRGDNGKPGPGIPLEQLERYWQEAKRGPE